MSSTKESTAATCVNASKDKAGSREEESNPPPLPLGWTQVKRRRTKGPHGEDEYCCDDPSCQKRRRPAPLTSASVAPSDESKKTNPKSKLFRGRAVFCLQDSNPDWFQGYFFHQSTPSAGIVSLDSLVSASTSTRKAWGMLCEQQEVDACLQCAEGGYRVLKVTVYPFGGKGSDPTKVTVGDVEWTGGDMMRLLHAESRVRMEPEQLVTGKKAVPYVKGIFYSLLRRLEELQDNDIRDRSTDDAEEKVLQLIPDVAVVVGHMDLVVELPNDDTIEF